MSDFTWGTVTGAAPLRVRLDGDAAPLPITPDSLAGAVLVGDRVRCEIDGNRIIVHGRGGGGATLGNLLINGEFRVNQRNYINAAALAAGIYGFDRWASTIAGTTLTFSPGVQATAVTLNAAGAIRQTVERESVRAGLYVLAWNGTAVGRIYNASGTAPAYAASPVVVALDGAGDVRVEFYGGGAVASTLSAVQLVVGATPGAVEHLLLGEEVRRCQRYFVQGGYTTMAYVVSNTGNALTSSVFFPAAMRIGWPTIVPFDAANVAGKVTITTAGGAGNQNGITPPAYLALSTLGFSYVSGGFGGGSPGANGILQMAAYQANAEF